MDSDLVQLARSLKRASRPSTMEGLCQPSSTPIPTRRLRLPHAPSFPSFSRSPRERGSILRRATSRSPRESCRIFPDRLAEGQRVSDHLSELGALAKTPAANIIKLPNISASIPQLKAAIAELQSQGYDLPEYPEDPQTPEDRCTLRGDTTQSRAVRSTLYFGKAIPTGVRHRRSRRTPARIHTAWVLWSSDSKTHVATMAEGDFFHNEQSVTVPAACTVGIEHVATDGTVTMLKRDLELLAG